MDSVVMSEGEDSMVRHLRPSRVLERLRGGHLATAIKINLADARVVEIAARAGFDCVWVDLEHVGNTLADIERGIWAAKAHNVDTLVRVPRGSYSDYIRPLELDAAGIMVPHVMSAADAASVVARTRFHPLGRRPVDGGNADGGYSAVPFDAYLREANDERFVVLQIEDPEPLDELEAIAAQPGVDMLFFGPGDFSQSIGAPGDFGHPLLVEARRHVARVAAEHGKFAGTVGSPATLSDLVALGYQFVSLGADVVGLVQYFDGLLSDHDVAAQPLGDGIYDAN